MTRSSSRISVRARRRRRRRRRGTRAPAGTDPTPLWRARAVIEKILERDPAEELSRAFQLFDDDNTGRITLKNLKKVAREIDEDIDEEELADMIHEFDRDGDGEINQEEFYELMRSEL